MFIREIISEDKQRIDEIAPALVVAGQALYWGFMAYSAYRGIRAMYDVYSRWHDGEITDEQLKEQIGTEAWETVKDILFFHAGVKAAKLSWQAFRRLMNAARNRPAPNTTMARDAASGGAAAAAYNLAPGDSDTVYP